jgi:hypothetical protein
MSAQAPVASPPRRQRGVISSWWHGLTLGKKLLVLSLPVLLLYDLNEVRKDLSENKSIEAASKTVFAVPGEIEARYSSCYYYDLVVCSTTPPAEKQADLPQCKGLTGADKFACELQNTPAQPARFDWSRVPFVGFALTVLERVPRLPDAMKFVLVNRWRDKQTKVPFGVALFFVLAWLAMMVWSLRRKFPGNLALFGIAVLAGPYLIEAFFWLIHVALQTAALPVQWLAARVMVTFGNLFCAVFAVSHDVKGIGEVADSIHHIAAIRRLRP